MTAKSIQQFEAQLQAIQEEILKMGKIVEEMTTDSLNALLDRDSGLAAKVISRDNEVNALEIAIDDLCVNAFTDRPEEADHRVLSVGLKITKDLERMGDLTVNVCERVLELNKEDQLKPYVDLPKLANRAKETVHEALEAFIQKDAKKAQEICVADDLVEKLYFRIVKELIRIMQFDATAVSRGINLIWVAQHYERIADDASNIAEEVVFMVEGRDVRHQGSKK